MIYDTLDNFDRYAALFPEKWDLIKEFFGHGVIPESGRYDLLPNGELYVNVQRYNTKAYDSAKLEYHKDYTDIQLLFLGQEDVVVEPVEGRETATPYSAATDCGFCCLAEGSGTRLTLKVGNFVLFFPGEGHIPCLGDPDNEVIKAVVKIKMN